MLGTIASAHECSSGSVVRDAREQLKQCLKALEDSRRRQDGDTIALLCSALAALLLSVPIAPEDQRLDKIIEVCSAFLNAAVHTPPDGAAAQAHALLAQAYFHRLHRDREDDARCAVQHLKAAIALFPPEADSAALAATHHKLGAMYTEIGNWREAIDHCEVANRLLRRDDDRLEWALIQSDLGLAYLSGEGPQMEAGITHLSLALQVLTPGKHPRLWAHAQERLGIAFENRDIGDKSDNLEVSIAHYRNALSVFSSEAWPLQRMNTLNMLGGVYYKRLEGPREDNLSLAIECLEEAASLAARLGEFADDFTLARAYFSRQRGNGLGDLERSSGHYRAALKHLDARARPAALSIARRELAKADEILARAGQINDDDRASERADRRE